MEEWAGEIGYLSQNPNDYLFLPTVRDEIVFTLKNLQLPQEEETSVDILLEKLGLHGLAQELCT